MCSVWLAVVQRVLCSAKRPAGADISPTKNALPPISTGRSRHCPHSVQAGGAPAVDPVKSCSSVRVVSFADEVGAGHEQQEQHH